MLRHLVLLDLLATDGYRFTLTEMGSILADPDTFTSQALHHDKIHTQLEMSFLGLMETIRTGKPARSHSFAAKSIEPGFVADFHEEAAFGALYRAPALPDAIDLDGVATTAVYGEAAGVYADTLARMRPDIAITLVGLPATNQRNLVDVAQTQRIGSTRASSLRCTLPSTLRLQSIWSMCTRMPMRACYFRHSQHRPVEWS